MKPDIAVGPLSVQNLYASTTMHPLPTSAAAEPNLRPNTTSAVRRVITGFACLLLAGASQAQSVWHCSKHADASLMGEAGQLAEPADHDTFQIAALSNHVDVIGITLRDLMDVYAGVPVRISGEPLTACFNNDSSSGNLEALSSLGLNPNVMTALARDASLVRSQLVAVNNPAHMQSCIERHYPAVGYFTQALDSNQISPCF